MKRIFWLFVIFFILTSNVGALASSSLQSIDGNIINGGFEQNPADPSSGWNWPGNDWVWDGSISHTGQYSAKVSRQSGEESDSLWSIPTLVQASTIYEFSIWLRTDAASKNPSVVIYQYNSGDIQTGLRQIVYSNVGAGKNDWSLVTYRFQTMPDATQVRLRIYLYTDTTGTFWFDDFSLNPIKPAIYPFLTGFPVEASGWVYLSSPAVVDINNDGSNEILIGADNSVNGWDAKGNTLPGYPLVTADRYIYNQLAIADLDADNRMEIVAGTRTSNPPEGQCRVYAWNDNGSLLNGWPNLVDWNPQFSNNDCKVTSIVLSDVDGNQNLEVLASTTNNASGNPNGGITPQNLYAWRSDGTNLSGNWPGKLTAAGFYGSIASGDINNDGIADVFTGRDHHMLAAYNGNGNTLLGWPIKTYIDGNQGDYQTDYRIVYGRAAPVLADLNNNGQEELIVVGYVSGPGNSTDIINTALLVLNKDGSRFTSWESPALGDGVLTQEDLPQLSPAIGDINADGLPEIIVATLDGSIRAFDLHKNLLWEFDFTQGSRLFATEPVIGDIDGDSTLEVLFGTYVPISSKDYDGPVGLWSLENNGSVTPGFPLPIPTPGTESAPTLADVDGDMQVEIITASIMGDVFVWDTPNPLYPARFPWPMGRHDLQRTANYIDPSSFKNSIIVGTPYSAKAGDIATFTIHISSLTPINDTLTMTDTIPAGLNILPETLIASSGSISERHGVIYWSGVLPNNLTVDISYQATITTNQPRFIINSVMLDTTIEGILQREAYLAANTYSTYLPSLFR